MHRIEGRCLWTAWLNRYLEIPRIEKKRHEKMLLDLVYILDVHIGDYGVVSSSRDYTAHFFLYSPSLLRASRRARNSAFYVRVKKQKSVSDILAK